MTTLLRLVKPALGRVALELMTSSERTKSGIYLAGQSETLANVGTVIAVSDPFESAEDDADSARSGPLFPVGALVVIGKYNGVEVTLNDTDRDNLHRFIIVNESDILCTLEEYDNEQAN